MIARRCHHTAGWLVVLLTSVLSSVVQSADDTQNCTLIRQASLDMTFDASGRANVPMTVAGRDLRMLVDTGGFVSSLNAATVKSLDLPTGGIGQSGITMLNGDRFMLAAHVNDVLLGKAKLSRWPFLVSPPEHSPPGADGILAPDILSAYDVDLDFGHGKLNLFSKDHCRGEVVYWTNDDHAEIPISVDETGHIVITVELDGSELKAVLDTGASRTLLSLEEARRLFGDAVGGPASKRGGDPDTFHYPFKALRFGGVSVINPDIVLMSEDRAKIFAQPFSNLPKLLIGMPTLRRLHLYIAYFERKLYVTPADAH